MIKPPDKIKFIEILFNLTKIHKKKKPGYTGFFIN